MGTHPIFESDFDCLTDCYKMVKPTSVSPFTLAMLPKLVEDQDNECLTLPDGRLIGTVKLVGRVENIEDREGFRALLFDDSTGFRVIRDYKEKEDQTHLSRGDYVRVFGSCKVAKGGKGIFFNAFEIKKLDDSNAADHMTSHLCEIILAHLRKVKGVTDNKIQNGQPMANQTMNSKPVAAVPMENFGEGAIPGASADQNKVLAIVRASETEEGADIRSDFDILGMEKDKLHEIMNWLSDEGHIYSTVDDDHFKTT